MTLRQQTRAGRRQFLREAGVSAASLPFLLNLPSLGWANTTQSRRRVLFVFSPNGTIPEEFWPKGEGRDAEFGRILKPLEKYRDRMLTLKGVANKVRGDGDNHMRGMSCLLTGAELFPGNIQGGSHTPAGWSSGISIDQELKNFLQGREETRTRFGSLVTGVTVSNRADPWTRWSYAGPNQPVAPIDDPYQLFDKLYGRAKNEQLVSSLLDDIQADLRKMQGRVSEEDRHLLAEHAECVREMEREFKTAKKKGVALQPPTLQPGVKNENDNMPALAKMQIDLLASAFRADLARVATLQFTKSVGQAGMNWLGVDENHHQLSHEPDGNESAREKLIKINTWFAEQVCLLADRLAAIPEPGGAGTLLDNTTIVWTNELGKGNSHTLNDIPFLVLGGGLGFKTGLSHDFHNKVTHNRLLLSFAHGMGHHLETFGKPELCQGGVIDQLWTPPRAEEPKGEAKPA